MSAIQKELTKLLDIDPPKRGDRQEFLVKLIKGVSGLSDQAWDDLSAEAQAWFNAAVDAKNAKAKELPDFPDLEAEAEADPDDKPTRRRSKADEDEPSKGGTNVDIDVKDLEEKMPVTVVTTRGKEYTGHVSEIGKDFFVVKAGDGNETEIDFDRVKTLTTIGKAKEDEKPSGRRSKADDEPADPIKVGVEVKLVTKRGKEATGKIVELDDEVIVLKTKDGDEEFDRTRVESVTPIGGKAKEDDKPASRRGKADDKDKGDDKGKEGRTRSSNPEGVSVSQRISELILDDLGASEEAIGKQLKKEGIEFRENTLNLNYKATHKLLDLIKSRKMLKV